MTFNQTKKASKRVAEEIGRLYNVNVDMEGPVGLCIAQALTEVRKQAFEDSTPEPVVVELVEHWTKQKGIAHIMPRPPEALGSTNSMKSYLDYRVGIE